jgi:cytochrome P450
MGNVIIGVMRKAMKDVEIKGYLIPKGWCVFTYFRSVHLDENHYEWPYKFNPWRWQVRRAPTFSALFVFFCSSFVVSFSFLVMELGGPSRTKT